jgi:hypothetical protein
MSDNRVLNKYLSRGDSSGVEAMGNILDMDGADEDCGAFGVIRGGQRDRAVMLELRRKSGEILVVGYGWIEKIEYVPSVITLYLPGQSIIVRGRNLNSCSLHRTSLLQSLSRHRVYWIQQSDRSGTMGLENNAVVVEGIEW